MRESIRQTNKKLLKRIKDNAPFSLMITSVVLLILGAIFLIGYLGVTYLIVPHSFLGIIMIVGIGGGGILGALYIVEIYTTYEKNQGE